MCHAPDLQWNARAFLRFSIKILKRLEKYGRSACLTRPNVKKSPFSFKQKIIALRLYISRFFHCSTLPGQISNSRSIVHKSSIPERIHQFKTDD